MNKRTLLAPLAGIVLSGCASELVIENCPKDSRLVIDRAFDDADQIFTDGRVEFRRKAEKFSPEPLNATIQDLRDRLYGPLTVECVEDSDMFSYDTAAQAEDRWGSRRDRMIFRRSDVRIWIDSYLKIEALSLEYGGAKDHWNYCDSNNYEVFLDDSTSTPYRAVIISSFVHELAHLTPGFNKVEHDEEEVEDFLDNYGPLPDEIFALGYAAKPVHLSLRNPDALYSPNQGMSYMPNDPEGFRDSVIEKHIRDEEEAPAREDIRMCAEYYGMY